MSKAKVKRASTSIDMTAMCDVSFLLLTFFVLTATARQQESLIVDAPASYSQSKLPDGNVAMITVGDEGKVFFHLSDQNVRLQTLQQMGALYGIEFSPEEYAKFKSIEDFGVSMKTMKTFLAAEASERTGDRQNGIPVDSTMNTSNELFSWVKQSRLASAKILRDKAIEGGTDPDDIELLTVAIKADAGEKFPSLNLIIETLRNQKQNKFSFVTGLKAD